MNTTIHLAAPPPDFALLLTPLAVGIAWFLPAIATLVSNAFGAFAKKKARGEQQRQINQKWQQYQTDWAKWRDEQNTRNEALSRYITEQGWDERLGPLKSKMVAPIVGNAPGGNAPRVSGSFWDDFLGSTAGSLPGLMLSFGQRGGYPASTGGQIASAALSGLGQQGFNLTPPSASNPRPLTIGPGGVGSGAYPESTPWPTPTTNDTQDDGLDAFLAQIYGSGFQR